MTHPMKPDRRGPLAISEEDKARAMALYTRISTDFVDDLSHPAAIAAEFARIREEERKACAASLMEIAMRRQNTHTCRIIGAGHPCTECAAVQALAQAAAAIRSRGEGGGGE